MNLPNKLTIARFIMAPIFLALMLIDFEHHYAVALVVFIVASLTDLFDGKIARERKLITNFGKFLDPIADKMITTSAFLAFLFLHMGWGIIWITFFVLAREFVVTSVRLVAADNGKVIAANFWGKLKTVMQMVAIITTLLFEYLIEEFVPMLGLEMIVDPLRGVYSILLWISAIFTIIAGVTYVIGSREFIKIDK